MSLKVATRKAEVYENKYTGASPLHHLIQELTKLLAAQ